MSYGHLDNLFSDVKLNMDNKHEWKKLCESQVTTRLLGVTKAKSQWLWACDRCEAETILDDGVDPNTATELYEIQHHKELDGITIMNPALEECDVKITRDIMES